MTVAIRLPFRVTRYSATPTLSVDAVHVNDTWLLDGAVPRNEPGALGACVSGVVIVAMFEKPLRFPALSVARTR